MGQEDEQTDGCLLVVRFKEVVRHRLWNGCRTSEKMRLEAEIETDRLHVGYDDEA